VEQLRRTTASEELFAVLRDAIVAGRYEPGEKLPSQRTVAREYGVNATTVREAIKRLEQLKLVDVRHGDAMRVSDWRTASGLDVIAHVLFDATGVNRDTLRSLMEARRWMLAVAAGLAAERRSDEKAEEIAALARVAGEQQAADFGFFAAVVEAAGNVVFSLILNSVRAVYFEHAALFAPLAREELRPLYERAAEAIVRRDAEGARAAVAELAERQERALEEALGADR
jgi:GntR family transcriptional regulator, transcriptional repressor for pyruvate dehydrogenase complex